MKGLAGLAQAENHLTLGVTSDLTALCNARELIRRKATEQRRTCQIARHIKKFGVQRHAYSSVMALPEVSKAIMLASAPSLMDSTMRSSVCSMSLLLGGVLLAPDRAATNTTCHWL